MHPTFENQDYIFTSKITYKFRKPERGDVIVFKSPKNPDIEYIKRIIAVPGDMVRIQNREVYVNNIKLNEHYISAKTNLWEGGYLKENDPVLIPQGYLFVMGDNRPNSSDSREFGPIQENSIVGFVFYRYFPSAKIGVIKNPFPENLRSLITLPFSGEFSQVPRLYASNYL